MNEVKVKFHFKCRQVAKLTSKKTLFQLPKNSWKANRAGRTFSSLMTYKKKRSFLAGFLDERHLDTLG